MKLKIYLSILFACTVISSYAQKATFNHVAIIVANANRSVDFYTSLFHLDTVKSPFKGGTVRWISLGGVVQLHIIQGSKEQITVSKGNHIAFSVASMDDFIKVLKKDNIPFHAGDGSPETFGLRPDGVKQIYFNDPDGYLVEVNDAH